ncbi:MAG: SMC family ATPase [Chloroflexi bacterium]|nr:SMC family ATPase [Chloroflexota bacterium]
MRPTKLKVQGLTAFRKPVEVDFRDLDLFAITGPTGAGKSSLVDAISYALFGQIPRVGSEVKQLISPGGDSLTVELEFSHRGARCRIHRSTRRTGQGKVQFETFDARREEWIPVADRVKQATEEIENLLGMDYEGFTRSIILPQGEFERFVKGEPRERRRVLDGLLRLGVYGDMQRAANAIAARQNDNATRIAARLASELADATPAALKEAKKLLADLEAEAKAATTAREALDKARRTAETLSGARAEQRAAAKQLEAAEKELEKAKDATQTGETKAESIRKKVAWLAERLEANTFDADEYLRYREATRLADELAAAEKELADVDKERAALESRAKAASAEAKKAASGHESAEKAAQAAQAAFDAGRRANAAAALQQRLKAGDPCPVCGQSVGELPHIEHPELKDAQAAAKRAKDGESAARTATEAAKRTLTQLQTRVESAADNLGAAARRVEERRRSLKETLGREPPPAKEIAAHLLRLQKAETERKQLAADLEEQNKKLAAITDEMKEATSSLARLQAEAKSARGAEEGAAEKATAAEKTLREASQSAGWDDVVSALARDQDASPVVERRLRDAQERDREVSRAIGVGETRIAAIAAEIERAKELRAEEKEAREEARVAKDLASLLRANAFPSYIREEALRTLARDGSRRLLEISQGRYSFVVEGQDFSIEDRWNGGEKRSVKTLSGGETFLASLALALALAEQLPGLAGEESGGTLESLFIDEGFSHLDSETLDIVASALEVLGQDRSRLIGVITHVPALAERMPARIVVHKTQAGSSVSVE